MKNAQSRKLRRPKALGQSPLSAAVDDSAVHRSDTRSGYLAGMDASVVLKNKAGASRHQAKVGSSGTAQLGGK